MKKTITILYCSLMALSVDKTSAANLSWQFLGLKGVCIHTIAIDPTNPANMYTGSNHDGIYKSNDKGLTWRPSVSGMRKTSTKAFSFIKNDSISIYAATGGGIYKCTNVETNWRKIHNYARESTVVNSFEIDPKNPSTFYCGTHSGLERTTDNGLTWKMIGLDRSTINSIALDPDDSDVIYASTDLEDLYKSTDHGENWSKLSNIRTSYSTKIQIIKKNQKVIYLNSFGDLYKSENNGLSWMKIAYLYTILDVKIDPTNPSIIYVASGQSNYQGVYKTTDGGANWLIKLKDINPRAICIHPDDPSIIFAGTYAWDGAELYKSTNGGETWNKKIDFKRDNAESIWSGYTQINTISINPYNSDMVLIGLEGGDVYRSNDRGETWSYSGDGISENDNRNIVIKSNDPSNLFATYDGMTILKSTNYGSTWLPMHPLSSWSSAINCLAIDPINTLNLYAGCDYFGVYKSSDGGNSWSKMTNGMDDVFIYSIAIDPQNSNHLFSGSKNVYKSTDGGEKWTMKYGGGYHILKIQIDYSKTNYVYASGSLMRSTDHGDSWQYIFLPQVIPEVNTSSVLLHPLFSNIIFAATYRDGIFRSEDRGENWVLYINKIENHSITCLVFDPLQPSILFAGTDDGIYKCVMPNHPPDKAGLISPFHNVYLNAAPNRFTWNAPADVDKNTLHFKIEINDKNDFSGKVKHTFSSMIDQTGFSPFPPMVQGFGNCSYDLHISLDFGTYWWRVTAFDGYEYGEPSEIRSFTITRDTTEIGVPDTIRAATGQALDIPVYVSTKDTVSIAQVTFEYNQSVIKYTGADVGPDARNFIISNENRNLSFGPASPSADKNVLIQLLGGIRSTFTGDSSKVLILHFQVVGSLNTSGVLAIDRDPLHTCLTASNTEGIPITRFRDCMVKVDRTTGIFGEQIDSSIKFQLWPNYPNPFNQSTKIKFSIPEERKITISIFNLKGEEVDKPIAEKSMHGDHEINWDAKELSSGIYFCSFNAGNYIQIRKLILTR